MSKLVTPGVIAAVCTAAGAIAAAYGATDIAAVFNDPATPTHVVAIIGVVGSLVAGLLPGLGHKAPAPVAEKSA